MKVMVVIIGCAIADSGGDEGVSGDVDGHWYGCRIRREVKCVVSVP